LFAGVMVAYASSVAAAAVPRPQVPAFPSADAVTPGDRSPPFLRDNLVEGLILKGPNQGLLPSAEDNPLLAELMRLPRVWLMGRLPNAVGDHCNFDTEHAGRLVAEHLHTKGHRRVAFMNPKPGQSQFERVKAAFTYFGHRLGLDVQLLESESRFKQQWPLPAITNQANVDELTQRWADLPEATRPTAIFVPSDRTATQHQILIEPTLIERDSVASL